MFESHLEQGQDFRETLITPVLKQTEDTSPEENLGVAETVVIGLQSQCSHNLLSHNLSINESLWDSVGSQDGVTVINEKSQIHYWAKICNFFL